MQTRSGVRKQRDKENRSGNAQGWALGGTPGTGVLLSKVMVTGALAD